MKKKFIKYSLVGLAALSFSEFAPKVNASKTSIQTTPFSLRGKWFSSNQAGNRQFTRIGSQFVLTAKYMYFHHKNNNHPLNHFHHFNMSGVTLYSNKQSGDRKLNIKLKGYKDGSPVYQLADNSPLYWTTKMTIRGKYQTVLKSLSNNLLTISTQHPIKQNNTNK